ncbi:MAG: hypothetical protein WC465_02915 [Patescibacteria group bacterium]
MPKILSKLNQKGASAIIALLLLSLMLASVLGLTSILLDEVKVSLNAENVVAASYVAESGVEQALYYIKYSRQQSDFNYYTDLQDEQKTLNNNGKFQIKTAALDNISFDTYNVATNSPAHVDIVDPAGNISNVVWPNEDPSQPANYSINWSIENCYPDHASDRLEVTVYSFGTGYLDPSGSVASPDITKNVYVCACGYSEYSDTSCLGISGPDLSTSRYYRFVFRPLDDTAKRITFYLNGKGIYSQALIEVDGVYRTSQYRLRATLPALSPASDIFSYVIFSEEELIK